ncbi:hypothetical protein H0H87_004834 [Tephrocybe sp. NHM501043]|nr:hypothetical protein H0H87_004834 [Tephrocybe sp. NHM501043]
MTRSAHRGERPMLSLNYSYLDAPDSVPRALYAQNMPDPISPTYTACSAPSPFSSGSSASFPNHSPLSEPFDVDDYSAAYAPQPSSLPMYNDLSYVPPQVFDLGLMTWSPDAPSGTTATKRQPPPPPSSFHHSQQQFPHAAYRPVPSEELSTEVERLKNLALYIPSTSPSSFHQQRQHSPTIVHSPIPIAVPPPHSPSLASHSPHPLQQSHRPQQHYQDHYFHVEVDKWRASPTTSHQPRAPYPPAYTHTHSHSGTMAHAGYPSSLQGDSSTLQRSISEYSAHHPSNNSVRIKQEEVEMYSTLDPYNAQHNGPRQRHIFDLSASPPKTAIPTHSQHIPAAPQPSSSSSYYRPSPQHEQHRHRSSFSMHPADLTPTEPTITVTTHHDHVFDTPPADMGYSADTVGEFDQATMFEASFGDVCDPQFVTGLPVDKSEFAESEESEQDNDHWEALAHAQQHAHGQMRSEEEHYETEYAAGDGDAAGERAVDSPMADYDDADADADADADGEDDLESAYASAGYPPPPPHRRGESPEHEVEPLEEEDCENDDDDDDVESEDDDMRDPEFVVRHTRRRVSSSYPHTGSPRSLRSTRYNPYPASYSTSPTTTEGYMDDLISAASAGHPHSHQDHYTASSLTSSQPPRPRRSYSHTSVSPSASETYSSVSAGGSIPRRRSRPTTTLPIPVPVPNLTKKSRGRRVPTMEDFQDEENSPVPVPAKGRKKGAVAKGMRTYTCDVDGCGKLFARGEHLKRHIRSIHTYEKR